MIGRRAFVRGRKPLGPFWTLVSIRVAFWVGAALTLLWAPLRHGFPPFRAYEARTDLLFDTFAQWDSGWYLHIAQHGYDSTASTSFFPLYPLAVRGSAEITRSHVVAAVLLSLIAAGVAAVLVSRIASPLVGAAGARDTVLYLALYPVAFVFTSAYSEGLFLALAAAAFLAATHDRPWLAGLLGGLAVDTRLVGIALLPALLYILWPRSRTLRDLARPAPLLLLPAALGAYMLYLDRHVGDAFAFQKAQRIYWLRHTPTLGPLGGLWDALAAGYHGAAEILRHLPRQLGEPSGFPQRDTWATYNVVHLVLLAAALWLTWIVWKRLGPALGLYAFSVQLVLLSATVDVFPLASYPRYLIADFPLFIALASLTRDRPRAREATLVGFAAIGAVAAVAFAHNVWVA